MPTTQETRGAFDAVSGELMALDIHSSSSPLNKGSLPGARHRRVQRPYRMQAWNTVSLVRVGGGSGVLYWFDGAPSFIQRVRGGVVPAPLQRQHELVDIFQFEKLSPAQIQPYLDAVDCRLNDRKGLWRLRRDGTLQRADRAIQGEARRLILLHGSLGCGQAMIEAILRSADGRGFIAELFVRYDEIYLDEHRTLSQSATENAHDLMEALRDAGGTLDLIAYCRGGLVARRFLEVGGYRDRRCRLVLVACPMAGTSLAAPSRFRSSLSLLTNYMMMMSAAGAPRPMTLPLLIAPLALMRLSLSLGGYSGADRLRETAITLAPGLADLVKGSRHAEQAGPVPPGFSYAIVRSRFACESPERQFWKWFRAGMVEHPPTQSVFRTDNDLLVDTDSMAELKGQRPGAILELQPTDGVHHGNYFEQRKVLDFILEQLPPVAPFPPAPEQAALF